MTKRQIFEPGRLVAMIPSGSMPANALLDPALECAFFSSLLTDEGRFVNFTFAVPLPDRLRPLDLSAFATPLSLDPAMLKRFAAALDASVTCFVVAPVDESPAIVGTTLRPQRASIENQYGSTPSIVVDAPGRVSLIVGDQAAVYDRGEYRVEESAIGAIRQALPPAGVNKLVVDVTTPSRIGLALPFGSGVLPLDPERWAAASDTFIAFVQDLVPDVLADHLRITAGMVRAFGHGGGILVDPGNEETKSVFTGGVSFQADTTERFISVLSQSTAVAAHLRLALRSSTWVVADLRPEYQADLLRWVQEVHAPKLASLSAEADYRSRDVAHLTQCDGAVILGADLRPLAFGTKLTGSAGVPPECSKFLESRGTRHTSMARTVAAVEGALGIVVSQDGAATVFHRPTGGELVFREVAL